MYGARNCDDNAIGGANKGPTLNRLAGLSLLMLAAIAVFIALPPASSIHAGAGDATGTPIITGTVQASETLMVDTSGIADGDSLVNVAFSYQWISNDGTTDTDISDETSSAYIIRPWDLGNQIKVRVSFTDDAGNEEALTSAATTAVVASPNHPASGWLKLLGMAEVGQTLRVVDVGGLTQGIRDANGLTYATFSYQWIRSDGTTDVEIPSANGQSYTPVDADEGMTIKVRMSYIDDGANAETLTSTETTAVTAKPSTSELSAPTDLSVAWSEGEANGNELNWTAPEGTITGYQILRLETPTRSKSWEPYAYGCTPLMEVHVSDTGGDATTYMDTDVAEGASYTYSVRAISSDGVGRKSSSSNSLQYRPPHTPTGSYWPSGARGTPYRVPANLASSQIKNGIGLTWEAPEGEVTGYQILRRNPEQCDFGYRVYVENTNSTDTHWADRDVVAGTLYEYHIRAVNDVGAGRLDTGNSASLRPTTLVVGPEPNNPATGTPTITGTPQVGETLTADPSGITDADGMHWANLSYQWLSSLDTEIEGATSPTYTLQASDANKAIKVRVDFMDDSGYEESLTSAATAAVSPNIPATGAPAITGTVEVGETLTADTSGISDTDGLANVSFSYQWIHSDGTDDLDVDGATGATYALTAVDVDKAIKLRVNFTDDKGSVESLTSPATSVVPIEATFTFTVDGTTVTCDSYNVHIVNVPIVECDDPTFTEQGASGEIEVGIEIARSVSSQSYKFIFHISQIEDSFGRDGAIGANDLCLGPGLTTSVTMEVTPEDGTGDFTYTDTGTIFELCPAGTFHLLAFWYRYNNTDQEYEYAGTFRRYFFITSDGAVDASVEKVRWNNALYPDPPVSHGDVQIDATRESEVLNRQLTTYSLSIGGLVPDSDPETTDYVVRLQIIGTDSEGRRRDVPWCHLGNVGYSYQLKTVPEDGVWAMQAHVIGGCLRHQWPDTLLVELFDGTDLTDYSAPNPFRGSQIRSPSVERLFPIHDTHKFIAGAHFPLGELANTPATGTPSISGKVQEGETLTADLSGIADSDGLTNATFTYQWSADDINISEATGSTYTLVATDVGKAIRLRVSFNDDSGNQESVTSEPTSEVPGIWGGTVTVGDDPAGTGAVGYSVFADGMGSITSPDFVADGEDNTVDVIAYNEDGLHLALSRELSTPFTIHVDSKTFDSSSASTSDGSETYIYTWDEPGLNWATGDSVQVIILEDIATNPQSASTNSSATGTPTISGSAQVDQTLTIDVSAIADEDGIDNATFAYQWVRSDGTTDSDIQGATASTYTLVPADEGKAIKVKVSFTDDGGHEETLTSLATAAVEARANRPATGSLTISGTPQVGETLAADTSGIADPDGLDNASFSYQWGASGLGIPGATGSTYTISGEDGGYQIQVIVTFTDDEGNVESLASTATAAVSAANSPATGTLTISGTAQVGETLTAETSAIADDDGLTSVSYSYQWVRNDDTDDIDIAGATNGTYTLVDADQGKTIKVRVAFTDDAGNNETLMSAATATVSVPVVTPPPAPTNLSVTLDADGSLTLNWTAPSDDSVTGYQILRRRPQMGESALQVYVNDTGSTSTTYTDTGTSDDTRYVYRVKARNSAGVGPRSNFARIDK